MSSETRSNDRTREFTGKDVSGTAGAGAAGGLGFAFLSFLPGVELKSGIEIVLKAVELEKELSDADIAVTGEVTDDAGRCNREGIDAFFPVVRGVCTLDEAMRPAAARNKDPKGCCRGKGIHQNPYSAGNGNRCGNTADVPVLLFIPTVMLAFRSFKSHRY